MDFDFCQSSSEMNKEIKQAAQLLKVAAEENRLRILCLLRGGGLCVCEIFEKLNLPQNLTSHHLSILKKAKLVADEKKGRQAYYLLTPKGIKATKTILELTKRGGVL